MKSPFELFVDSADQIVRSRMDASDIVTRIEPLLHDLVEQQGWLDEPLRRPIPSKPYAQYLLYRPADWAFSIVSFVWNPGQGSPVHDHGVWGVIGQYEGEEEESRFRRTDRGVELVEVRPVRPGAVSHVYPPNRDVHRIWNRTSTPTVSIHIYGCDIGSQLRRIYDPETGEVRDFVSGYDIPEK